MDLSKFFTCIFRPPIFYRKEGDKKRKKSIYSLFQNCFFKKFLKFAKKGLDHSIVLVIICRSFSALLLASLQPLQKYSPSGTASNPAHLR